MGPISLKFKIILIECKFYSQTISCFDKENKLLKIQKNPVNIIWRKFSDVRDSIKGKRDLHSIPNPPQLILAEWREMLNRYLPCTVYALC